MSQKPQNSKGLKTHRDRNLIGDGDPQTCTRCFGTCRVGDGQGRWEATHGAQHPVHSPCPVCLGRGVIAAS
jgi:hypothetical protein